MSLHVFPCREYIHTVLNCGAYANRLCSRLPLSFNSNAASVSPGLFPRVHIYQPRRIRFSQSCVTSIDALSSPGKRAGEWEINCQTMHSSHPLRFSSCQMISKHYRMSGCIIYRTPLHNHRRRHLPSTAHIPVALSDGFVGPATKGSIRWRDFYPLFLSHHSPQPTTTCVALSGIIWHKHGGIDELWEFSESCHCGEAAACLR